MKIRYHFNYSVIFGFEKLITLALPFFLLNFAKDSSYLTYEIVIAAVGIIVVLSEMGIRSHIPHLASRDVVTLEDSQGLIVLGWLVSAILSMGIFLYDHYSGAVLIFVFARVAVTNFYLLRIKWERFLEKSDSYLEFLFINIGYAVIVYFLVLLGFEDDFVLVSSLWWALVFGVIFINYILKSFGGIPFSLLRDIVLVQWPVYLSAIIMSFALNGYKLIQAEDTIYDVMAAFRYGSIILFCHALISGSTIKTLWGFNSSQFNWFLLFHICLLVLTLPVIYWVKVSTIGFVNVTDGLIWFGLIGWCIAALLEVRLNKAHRTRTILVGYLCAFAVGIGCESLVVIPGVLVFSFGLSLWVFYWTRMLGGRYL